MGSDNTMNDLRVVVKNGIKAFIQRHGITVTRYPLQQFLRSVQPTTVLDVGANVGQYGLELRSLGYQGKIQSFEPFPSSFETLKKLADQSQPAKAWQVHNFGLGEKEGETRLNVFKESTFNSVREALPESPGHYDGITPVETVSIKISTLNSIWNELNLSNERVFLKMDTQGYELPILEGGSSTLEKIRGIQLEVSFTPLYKGQPCAEDIIPFLRNRGFLLFGAWPGQGIRGKNGEIFEMDFIFLKP
jgi:FkbM family methyltransferase